MREQVLQVANAQAHEMTLWIGAGLIVIIAASGLERAWVKRRQRAHLKKRNARRVLATSARVAQCPRRVRRPREVVR